MQIHQGESKVGDVLSLNILQGEAGERLIHLLLTQGIEIEVKAIAENSVTLAVRAPGGMMIVEEIAAPVGAALLQPVDIRQIDLAQNGNP
ncbi:hypothetical protein [Pseudomonas sp. PDM19]|uniref:hypothetical protein n=1 Tax=Pseudomonas sp. PDM19 TaxID=2769272 RepID=UPI001784FCA7|nr:hypothetical protein [Pseudomonas sp. PDM19]MBD9629533.1 hypothetical protein [Pseudomonas sp. PDM19]